MNVNYRGSFNKGTASAKSLRQELGRHSEKGRSSGDIVSKRENVR